MHHIPITKFARHFYTWPALGIEPQTFWSWVQCPIHLATYSHEHAPLFEYRNTRSCNIFSVGAPSIFCLFLKCGVSAIGTWAKNTTIGQRLYNPIISLPDPDYLFPEVMQCLRNIEWKNIYMWTQGDWVCLDLPYSWGDKVWFHVSPYKNTHKLLRKL